MWETTLRGRKGITYKSEKNTSKPLSAHNEPSMLCNAQFKPSVNMTIEPAKLAVCYDSS
jgi:hypothetical protein